MYVNEHSLTSNHNFICYKRKPMNTSKRCYQASDECGEGKDDLVAEKNEIKTETSTVKEEILVNAKVTIENSVNEVFSKGDFKSIENTLFGAKHLRENIVNLEAAGEMSSRQSRNERFKLMLNLKLLVTA